MMTNYPRVPAAFINVIAEGGTKQEAVEYLQSTWNEVCFLKEKILELEFANKQYEFIVETLRDELYDTLSAPSS